MCAAKVNIHNQVSRQKCYKDKYCLQTKTVLKMETVFKFLAQSERGREGRREKIDQREIDIEGERERAVII